MTIEHFRQLASGTLLYASSVPYWGLEHWARLVRIECDADGRAMLAITDWGREYLADCEYDLRHAYEKTPAIAAGVEAESIWGKLQIAKPGITPAGKEGREVATRSAA